MQKIKSFIIGQQYTPRIKRKILPFLILTFIFIFIAAFFSTVAIGQEPLSVKIGAYANHPKIFMDADGKVSGFWPDLIKDIAKKENWKIEYVWGTWSDGLDRLINKEIDIMPDVAFTGKRNKLYAFSEAPVLMSWTRLYINKKNTEIQSITDLKGKKIAALKGSVNLEGPGGLREIALGFNLNCTFLELDNYTEVFKAVEKNRADAGITNRNFGNKNANKFNLKKSPIIFNPTDIKFAFPKDAGSTPYLAERINYCITQLKQNEDSIYYRLLEKYFESEIAEKEVFPKWLGTTLKTIAALFVVFVLVIIATGIQVKRKTSEILAGRESLQKSETRYRLLAENAADVIWTTDMKLRPDYISPSVFMDITLGRFIPPASLELCYKTFEEELALEASGKTDPDRIRTLELEHICKDGSAIWVEMKVSALRDPDGRWVGILGVTRDITNRKKAEEKIKHLNLVLSAIRNVNQIVVTEKDRGHLIQRACDNLTETRGYYNSWIVLLDEAGRYVTSAEAGLGKDFLPMVEMLKRGELALRVKNALSKAGVVVTEDPASTCTDCPLSEKYAGRSAMTVRLEHGGKVYGVLSVSILKDFVLNEEEQGLFKEVAGDIAFALHGIEMEKIRKKAEDQIRRSLREKGTLLAEIHHRVKNNMQIISSLLSLQSRDIKDERALSLIKNCEDRIRSMSLVHEKLYLSEDLSRVDFSDYVESMATRLFQVHRVDSRVVSFSSHIKDVSFSIETAIPLGLIANELISNVLKHAFPEGRKGNISVELTQNRKIEEYTLTVTDNGIGFPEEIDYKNTETFGLQLVGMLTEQLNGTVELDRSKETSFKIVFKEQKYKKRI
ncbi:MAG: transporter substrate-binding domain-containing protein [Deltaproteobacteria bacterium]|nr:transporter substrate-binding domain-containing protein [Deltaproteobacteria bacterium]